MDKILTITVPSYNAQDYLEKCLDSVCCIGKDNADVLNQIEIIVVNDGSKDRTSEIAHKYESLYPGIVCVVDKENGGHGSGINTGITEATGKYFKVVDADDWLASEEIVDYIKILQTVDADIVASDFVCVDDQTGECFRYIDAAQNKEWYGNTVNINETTLNKVIKMHSFTIRTSILKKHRVPIDEHCFYVDHEYITFPVPYINTVYFDKRYFYMYRLGRAGQSMAIDVMKRNRLMHRKVLDRLINYYNQEKNSFDSANKLAYFKRCLGDMIDNQFQIYISLGNDTEMNNELKEWDTELKKTNNDLYHSISKRSITIIRLTDYKILPFANYVYRIVKKKG